MEENLYETISKRKSIRKYKLKPLEDEVVSEIMSFISKVEPLYKNIKTEITIVKQASVNTLLAVKAPQYLVISSEPKEGYLTNAGFMLQQLDLSLSSRGIGSCYLGMAKPKRATVKEASLEVVIIMAIGYPEEPLHRSSSQEFKRKALGEITNTTGLEQFLEPARLAPSGMGSQPWYFTGEMGRLQVYCQKPNLIKAFIYERMNRIDIGIVLCHIAIAVEHFGKKFEFIAEKGFEDDCPKGYYYIGTVGIK